MSKWKVYISSTFKDLKDFRAVLINLFETQLQNNFELSHIMERMFDDGTHTPFVKDCVKAVLDADIYIIILGNKIGSFPPNENRTYTEIELDTALANDKRIFCLRLENFNEAEIDNREKHAELLNKFIGKPIHSFKDIPTLRSKFIEILLPFAGQKTPINKQNPYKGLDAFGVEDGNYFFGRDEELDLCLKKIVTQDGNYFISIVGNSGTGKSSFVQAGILFSLKYQTELGLSKHPQIIIKPSDEPFTNLKYQLQKQGLSIENLKDPNSSNKNVILFFDQFEEVITQCYTEAAIEERKLLFEFLDSLVCDENPDSKILVICTFRSDFLSQLANFVFIKNHQYLFPIKSLDYKIHIDNWEHSIKEIIQKPAQKNGVTIETELENQLINQIKEVNGSLPILQLTLEKIWTKESIADRIISTSEYSKLSKGKGISGIIETHAENVFKEITQNGQNKKAEAIIKGIFINLVEVTQNQHDVKRTKNKSELIANLEKHHPKKEVDKIFELLVNKNSRLLNINQNNNETYTVEIIHEVLIRRWERLKGWINKRRTALEFLKRIKLDAKAFEKGEGELYNNIQVKKAKQWKSKNLDLSTSEINAFLDKSKNHINNTRYKYVGGTLSFIGLIVALFYFGLEWSEKKNLALEKQNFLKQLESSQIDLYNEIQSAGGLDSLKRLDISENRYGFLYGKLKYFKNIQSISISDIEGINDLSIFKNHEYASVDSLLIGPNILNLLNLSGIENLNQVKHLELWSPPLEPLDLKVIENFNNLKSLSLFGGTFIEDLKSIEKLRNLEKLELSFLEALTSLSSIENLENLRSLTISLNFRLKNLDGIEALKKLNFLSLHSNGSVVYPVNIENLTELRHLAIRKNDKGYNVTGIEKLENLRSLAIDDFDDLASKLGNEKLKKIKSLEIFYNHELISLNDIKNLETLENLDTFLIFDNRSLVNLNGIDKLKRIKYLDISQNSSLRQLNDIEKLDSLRSLIVFSSHFNPTMDYNILYQLKDLEQLIILPELELDWDKINQKNPGIKIN